MFVFLFFAICDTFWPIFKMPPRSKPIKIEWSKCNVCDCKFSSKDQDKHASICSKQRSYSLKDLTHGCVKNGTLFAFTTKHNDGTPFLQSFCWTQPQSLQSRCMCLTFTNSFPSTWPKHPRPLFLLLFKPLRQAERLITMPSLAFMDNTTPVYDPNT